MKILTILITLLLVTSFCQGQIDIKQLDGIISNEESKKLTKIGSNNQNHLFIDTSMEGYIKVVVRSEKLYVASLCVRTNEKEVKVLHASAALGDITYHVNVGENWVTNMEFNWDMRESDMNSSTIEKRKAFLEKYGWVANTMSMGKEGEIEFIINKNLFKNNETSLAIGLMTESAPNDIIQIPKDLNDDCVSQSLVSGAPEMNYGFKPNSWIKIKL